MSNQGYVLTSQVICQSSAAATGNGTAVPVAGWSAVSLQVSGTFVGTITFEGTLDNTNWVSLQGANVADGAVGTTATAAGIYVIPCVGLSQFRARVSAWTSGTITAIACAVTAAPGMTLADVDIQAAEAVTATLSAGELHLGEVGGHMHRVSAEVTRPADTTAYTAKDAIANATSGALVMTFTGVARTTAGQGYVIKAIAMTNQTTNTETFKIHLFNAAPTALQDNAVCTAPLYANTSSYEGTITIPACTVEATGATAAYAVATPNDSGSKLPLSYVCAADANLYGILEAPTGFTPASGQKITIIFETDVN